MANNTEQLFSATQDIKEVLQDNTHDIDWLENPLQLNNLESKYYNLKTLPHVSRQIVLRH